MTHRWTPDGVVVEAQFTGAHLYHLAAAGCVLNDVYREAERLAITLDGVRVRASGGFGPICASTGITYDVEVASAADGQELAHLVDVSTRWRSSQRRSAAEPPSSDDAATDQRSAYPGPTRVRSPRPRPREDRQRW